MVKVRRFLWETFKPTWRAIKLVLQPYRVIIVSLDEDKTVIHRAWTQVDAMSYMRGYGRAYGPHVVRITTRLGRIVASRALLA